MPIYKTAPRLAMPTPRHTLTPEAALAREAVAAYGQNLRQRRRGDGLPLVTAGHPRETAERIEPATLTGSPATLARKLAAAGARLAATRAAAGGALSVWAIMPDRRRVRAFYRRTATGWGSQGVTIDGRAVGVTAALVELGA